MPSDDTLRHKIGQLFIVGFHGHTPSPDILTLIRTHHVGSVILFQRNIHSSAQLLSLTHALQSAASASHAQPLLISTDQENGLVTRLPPPVAAQLPGAMAVSATSDFTATVAYETATATGTTLAFHGIHVNYAPVCDVNSAPENPVIGVRSPGDDGERVGRVAAATARGLRDAGVAPCAKHFPGHGDTAVDSHYGLPVITKNRRELEACELVPFRRLAVDGIDCIMMAHIALPEFRGGGMLPASLSEQVVSGFLRRTMKYPGVIVTDCLEMDGVRKEYGTPKAAVMALKAGSDAVMICHTFEVQLEAIEAVYQAVQSGEIPVEHIDAAVERIQKLKEKYVSWDKVLEVKEAASFAEIRLQHEALAERIYATSTTVVRDENRLLPLKTTSNIIFLSPAKDTTAGGAVDSGIEHPQGASSESGFYQILHTYFPAAVKVRFAADEELSPETEVAIASADAVVLATRNARLAPYQRQLGLQLAQLVGEKLVVIAICDPYDFLDDGQVKTYIATYEPTTPALEAAAKVLSGAVKASGVLPVGHKEPIPITDFDLDKHMDSVADIWARALPSYAIVADHLRDLLDRPHGHHLVALSSSSGTVIGFCATYTTAKAENGAIAALVVDPAQQSYGVGTALLMHARQLLVQRPDCTTVVVGSSFPRFWPGVPTDLPANVLEFFKHRGWCQIEHAADLYQDVTAFVPPPELLERPRALGITFAPWTPAQYNDCMALQRKNFGHNPAWVDAYERLHLAGQHGQVMVAHAANGTQIGWTLMLAPSQDNPVWHDMAMPPLIGPNVGLIACVGVDADHRKAGVGLGLLVAAIEDMRRRGVDGVFVDWVVLKGWYEKLGFRRWREYLVGAW